MVTVAQQCNVLCRCEITMLYEVRIPEDSIHNHPMKRKKKKKNRQDRKYMTRKIKETMKKEKNTTDHKKEYGIT